MGQGMLPRVQPDEIVEPVAPDCAVSTSCTSASRSSTTRASDSDSPSSRAAAARLRSGPSACRAARSAGGEAGRTQPDARWISGCELSETRRGSGDRVEVVAQCDPADLVGRWRPCWSRLPRVAHCRTDVRLQCTSAVAPTTHGPHLRGLTSTTSRDSGRQSCQLAQRFWTYLRHRRRRS
jgi:hypothetical protein